MKLESNSDAAAADAYYERKEEQERQRRLRRRGILCYQLRLRYLERGARRLNWDLIHRHMRVRYWSLFPSRPPPPPSSSSFTMNTTKGAPYYHEDLLRVVERHPNDSDYSYTWDPKAITLSRRRVCESHSAIRDYNRKSSRFRRAEGWADMLRLIHGCRLPSRSATDTVIDAESTPIKTELRFSACPVYYAVNLLAPTGNGDDPLSHLLLQIFQNRQSLVSVKSVFLSGEFVRRLVVVDGQQQRLYDEDRLAQTGLGSSHQVGTPFL